MDLGRRRGRAPTRTSAAWCRAAARPRCRRRGTARSLAGLTMTPTGTSTSKISCSRLANVNADSESPPRSVKCASGCRSAAAAPSSAPAARLTVSSTGRSAPLLAQLAQLVGLAVGQVGVELFEPLAVVLLELRPRQLADAGQQTVLEREGRCLDDEVARDLVGLQVRPSCATSCSESAISGFSVVGVVPGQRFVGRHDDRQQIGPGAVAVDEDLADQRAVAEHRLQLRDGDELALRQLQHVVAAVEVH